jgi:hypothetical protein
MGNVVTAFNLGQTNAYDDKELSWLLTAFSQVVIASRATDRRFPNARVYPFFFFSFLWQGDMDAGVALAIDLDSFMVQQSLLKLACMFDVRPIASKFVGSSVRITSSVLCADAGGFCDGVHG